MNKRYWLSKHRSIYKTLIYAFLFSVIPIFLLFFISNQVSLDEISRQKMNTLKTYLITNKERIENEVSRIFISQEAMISQDIVIQDISNRYGMMGSYELGSVVGSVNRNLRYLRNTSDFINNVSVYIPSIQREFSTKLYYNDNIDENIESKYSKKLTSPSNIIVYHESNIYVSSHSSKLYKDQIPTYYVYSQLDSNNIKKLLSDVEEDMHIVFFSKKDIVLSDDEPLIVNHVIDFINKENNASQSIITTSFKYENTKYLIAYVDSQYLHGTFVIYVPKSVILKKLINSMRLVWIIVFASAIVVLFLIASIYRMIKRPLDILTNVFSQVEHGNLDVEVIYSGNNEFGDLLHSFNIMVDKLKNMIEQIYVKNINIKNAQLKQLQAQISPHFLYNSFNILTHSIKRGDEDTALSMSKLLSNYFKYITQNNFDMDILRSEFDFSKTYIEIQRIRFGERVKINFLMIDPKYEYVRVPRMILQPLIENAYKHAFSNIVDEGILQVDWHIIDNNIKLIVQDNGPGVSPEKLIELKCSLSKEANIKNYGIYNVHQRLTLVFGEKYGLDIISEEGSFFRVEVTIPISELNR